MSEPTNKKVLIVDDDQFLLNMYSLKFKKNNFEVDTVAGANYALEKLRAGAKYDAIIFDIVMPGMDGFDMAETMKKEKLGGEAKLIALTNQSQQGDIDRGKEIGISSYIVKASTVPTEVVAQVEDLLKK